MALSTISRASDASFLSGCLRTGGSKGRNGAFCPTSPPSSTPCSSARRVVCYIAPGSRGVSSSARHAGQQGARGAIDTPWGPATVTFAMAPQPEESAAGARGGTSPTPGLNFHSSPQGPALGSGQGNDGRSSIPHSFLPASEFEQQCALMQEAPSRAQADQDASAQCRGSSQEGASSCLSCLRGWAVAAAFAKNDAAIMKRGLLDWDSRARQDVERLRTGVNYLDARARADAGILDSSARQRLRRMRSFALGMEEAARMELVQAAKQHRDANGALMADLEIADLRARRRALEDAFTAWQLAKRVHDSLVRLLRMCDTEEQDGRDDIFLSARERIPVAPLDEASAPSSSVARALSTLKELRMDPNFVAPPARLDKGRGADAITSSEELEFLLAALLDLDEVSEGSGALLLAQQLDSPDVATRKAIVDVLAAAPSLWALGNAGMGALQKLSKDEDANVAAAAERALAKLWEDFTRQDI